MFVVVSGMDGSGKTTLTHGLLERLNRAGTRVDLVYGKFQPLLLRAAFAVGSPIVLGGRFGKDGYTRYAERRRDVLSTRRFFAAYVGLVGIDYVSQTYVRVGARLAARRNVLCDRYYLDTVVADITVDAGEPEKATERLLKLARRTLPSPDALFVVDVPPQVAFRRKQDIPSEEYAGRLRDLYLFGAAKLGGVVLDGLRPPGQLVDEVLSHIDALPGSPERAGAPG